jgi:SAM-dependent methyltransferase
VLRNFPQTLDNFCTRVFDLRYLRLTRDALIHERAEYLVTHLQAMNRAGLQVLDVGCGSALSLLYLDKFCREQVSSYVGVDLQTGRRHDRYQPMRIPHKFFDLNIDDNWHLGTFDVVCCFEVIEHIMNDDRLFRLLCTHVANAGWLLLTTPSRAFVTKMAGYLPGFDRVSETQDGGHVRVGYSVGDFRRLAEQNDMEILSCDWVSRFVGEDLGAYLKRGGTVGTVLYNLRHPRREKGCKLHLGGGPGGFEDAYYSIAVCMAHKGQVLCDARS